MNGLHQENRIMVNDVSIIQKFNTKVLREFNDLDNQILSPGRLNSRADNRLKQFATLFQNMLGDSVVLAEQNFCRCSFDTIDRNYNTKLRLNYELKNMLFGRNYDLIIRNDLNFDEIDADIDSFEIIMNYESRLKHKGVSYEVEHGDDYAGRFARELNNYLISERILRLQLVNMRISYNKQTGKAELYMQSIKGSSTWSLIPPVFQFIKPKEKDCVDIVELVELIIHASRLSLNTSEECSCRK